jgi:hypothetical protein
MNELESHSDIDTNVGIERHEYVLPSVAKKVVVASVSSTEALPMVGLAL